MCVVVWPFFLVIFFRMQGSVSGYNSVSDFRKLSRAIFAVKAFCFCNFYMAFFSLKPGKRLEWGRNMNYSINSSNCDSFDMKMSVLPIPLFIASQIRVFNHVAFMRICVGRGGVESNIRDSHSDSSIINPRPAGVWLVTRPAGGGKAPPPWDLPNYWTDFQISNAIR